MNACSILAQCRAVAQRLDHRQFLAGQEPDQGPAAGADIAHFVRQAVLLGGSDAVAAAQDGEYIDDAAMGAILDEMREQAAAPTLEEINAANIDYLMMVGGEW